MVASGFDFAKRDAPTLGKLLVCLRRVELAIDDRKSCDPATPAFGRTPVDSRNPKCTENVLNFPSAPGLAYFIVIYISRRSAAGRWSAAILL